MKGIDLKSVLIGLLLGVCVILVLGAGNSKQADYGRYQIACPDNSGVCFVIDTTTGQVWQRFGSNNGQQYGSPDLWNK